MLQLYHVISYVIYYLCINILLSYLQCKCWWSLCCRTIHSSTFSAYLHLAFMAAMGGNLWVQWYIRVQYYDNLRHRLNSDELGHVADLIKTWFHDLWSIWFGVLGFHWNIHVARHAQSKQGSRVLLRNQQTGHGTHLALPLWHLPHCRSNIANICKYTVMYSMCPNHQGGNCFW